MIPVLIVEDVAQARAIAEALVAGGLRVLEVTLRTPAALDVIREMSRVEGAVVGAGTVLNETQLQESIDAGARFAVSPGLTERIGRAAIASGLPFLPGVSSPGDIMRGLDLGLSHFKFFPAVASGGIPGLAALSGPFAEARFCPTGGITMET
ncbi:MAG TPA: bifunctional 4-hydroxy-2-oxoglutarate aldolase/2-dehydro-3-deoxy-phosphogluconate aldolase, partial [Allosphingosinicella sp.]